MVRLSGLTFCDRTGLSATDDEIPRGVAILDEALAGAMRDL
ncbi:hypothetical protein [Streptomyces violaceusniger]